MVRVGRGGRDAFTPAFSRWGRKKYGSIVSQIWRVLSSMAFTSRKVFSLQGKSLKLDSRSDIESHLKDVDPTVIEEICLGGNTVGIEAAEALAEFLKKATALKVCERPIPGSLRVRKANLHEERSRTLQISLLVDSSPKYPPRCPRSATLSRTRPHSSSST